MYNNSAAQKAVRNSQPLSYSTSITRAVQLASPNKQLPPHNICREADVALVDGCGISFAQALQLPATSEKAARAHERSSSVIHVDVLTLQHTFDPLHQLLPQSDNNRQRQ